MPSLLIKNGHIINPQTQFDTVGDILIVDGIVHSVGEIDSDIIPDRIIDASGLCVMPGLVDVHVHFRDPGFTHKEDFESGSQAALAGGYTSVVQMPNTNPSLATPELVREYTRKTPVKAYVAACVTKNREGKELVDFDELYNAGAVAFTDDGSPVSDEKIMAEALMKSRQSGIPIMSHSENMKLSEGGVIIEGEVSSQLGVKGIPQEAESSMVERDIELARNYWGRLHICHVSTEKSVRLIRDAKEDNLTVTAEATPHHLLLNHKDVLKYGANAKMNPPLAYEQDRLAVLEGIQDGTIDIIASDHAPHSLEEKSAGLDKAPFGVVGLESAFPLLYTNLVQTGQISMSRLVEMMSLTPSMLFYIPGGSLEFGEPADITIVDLNEKYTIDASKFKSKSRNTPFDGWEVYGRVRFTIVDGDVRYE